MDSSPEFRQEGNACVEERLGSVFGGFLQHPVTLAGWPWGEGPGQKMCLVVPRLKLMTKKVPGECSAAILTGAISPWTITFYFILLICNLLWRRYLLSYFGF